MTEPRRFSVYARDLGAYHARLLEARSFESAAVTYAEDLHGVPAGEISIVVHDLATGHEHCFHIDLSSGETASCG